MSAEIDAIVGAVNGLSDALMKNLDISRDVKSLLQEQAAQGATLRDLKSEAKSQLEALFSLRKDDGERVREVEADRVSAAACQAIHGKVDTEISSLRSAVDRVTWRVAMICGGLVVISTAINWAIAAKFPAQMLGGHP